MHAPCVRGTEHQSFNLSFLNRSSYLYLFYLNFVLITYHEFLARELPFAKRTFSALRPQRTSHFAACAKSFSRRCSSSNKSVGCLSSASDA